MTSSHSRLGVRGAWPLRCLTLLSSMAGFGCSEASGPQEAPSSIAQAALEPTPATISATRYLRQLSFDLRGRPPSGAEVEAVAAAGRVPPETIETMLRSPEFLAEVRAWHAEVLWPNLGRYKAKAVSVTAFKHPRFTAPAGPYDVGDAFGHRKRHIASTGNASPDPLLAVDAKARQEYVVAIESDAWGTAMRGGGHAYGNWYCDIRAEAEYPDPGVVGTPANRYTVPAERSGTGKAYTALYYSEEPQSRGMVMPYRDYLHCPNFCRREDCSLSRSQDLSNVGPTAGCFRDMDTPGNDPAGRHELDTPGMRCAPGYVREVNVCDFTKSDWPINNYLLNGLNKWGRPRPQRRIDGLNAYNVQREGWRWVEHYWSRGHKVKTCALDAQERERGMFRKELDGTPTKCAEATANTSFYWVDASCGCGPQGAYCQPSIAEHATTKETRAEHRLRTAIEQEPLEIIASVIGRDEDYFGILTTKRSFVNGPLALAFGTQAAALRGEGFKGVTPPGPPDPAWAKVSYESDAWVEYTRPARHSGILTTLGFLLRFPTARARIAQYRRAFLCSSEFDYAPQPDPEDTNPDIAARNGCASCHQRLETEGLYFARYPDRMGVHLDPQRYPALHSICQYCLTKDWGACVPGAKNPMVPGGVVTDGNLQMDCREYYVTSEGASDRERPYIGALRPTLYRDQAMVPRVDAGPEGMVRADLQSGKALEACAATTLWNRLVRREIGKDELSSLLSSFDKGGRSYRELVRAVVTSDAYRTVQP
jgi:hypothetical protein